MAVGPVLTQLLRQFGLESLTNWAAGLVINNASPEEIEVELYKRPEFKLRFPGIFHREKYGYPPISVNEYLAYENTVHQVARSFGITLSKERVDAMVSLNVSAAEAEERIGMAATAVYQTDPTTREEFKRLYHLEDGDLVNYWLNPREALPLLQRKFTSAQISGSAIAAGFQTRLSEEQLGGLYERGFTGESASQAFGQLVEAEELFEAVDETEQDIGLEGQLSLIKGDVDIQQQVATRGERRAAKFQEGGGYASGQTGIAGLGSSTSQ